MSGRCGELRTNRVMLLCCCHAPQHNIVKHTTTVGLIRRGVSCILELLIVASFNVDNERKMAEIFSFNSLKAAERLDK